MSVNDTGKSSGYKKNRRILSPEKKFQIFLESQSSTTPVGELLRREGIGKKASSCRHCRHANFALSLLRK
jgi:hypothetical protein